MNNPKVSIIVPCFNQAQYLPEALQSVLDQTYENWECIIVNDGSPDNTKEVAQEWVSKDARFIYLFKENGGLSSARNAGIAIAKGEFILSLDSDDKYHPTFLEKGVAILISNTTIGVVSSWGIRFIEDKQFGEFRPNGGSIKDFLFSNAAIGTSLFRKECWEKVEGYDEKMKFGYEDWEFYIRVCKLGWTVHIIKGILFYYRQHAISMRTIALKSHDFEIKGYIFLKHKELYVANYEDFLIHFLQSVESQKKEVMHVKSKIDSRLGAAILKPFRIVKTFLSK